jgi:hypothetical protein
MVKDLPFDEIQLTTGPSEIVIRKFSESLDDEELKWHWDDEDRVIHSICRTDWMFQFDNQLPQPIISRISIPKGEWHRLIKGTGDLQIIVEKNRDI